MLSFFSWTPLRRLAAALCLALCFLISGVYAPSAIAQTDRPDTYLTRVASLSDRFNRLETYVNQSSWSDIKGYIHGPLGTIRVDISRVISTLPAKEQTKAKALAKKLFDGLVDIDFAVTAQDKSASSAAFEQVRKDYKYIESVRVGLNRLVNSY
ncbi:MAG: photosystem II protein PsbQ [Pseudanabaena sp. CRU_2_10]|nr:photosystem II protein PsbQ [Pseudanabaena sp. CRU_2_10]